MPEFESFRIKGDPSAILDSPEMRDLLVLAYDEFLEGIDSGAYPHSFFLFRAGFAHGLTAIEREIPGAYRFKQKETTDAK